MSKAYVVTMVTHRYWYGKKQREAEMYLEK